MKPVWLLLLIFLAFGCNESNPLDALYFKVNGDSINLKDLSKKKAVVLVFIAPVCPLCQNYSVTLKVLAKTYSSDSITFVGVVGGHYYSETEILKFENEYKLNFPVILDPNFKLSKAFKAEITPEVVLIDSLGENKYQGAIDNWAISLGQKRQTITAHYLNDALKAYLKGNQIKIKKTKAVGCFIE